MYIFTVKYQNTVVKISIIVAKYDSRVHFWSLKFTFSQTESVFEVN